MNPTMSIGFPTALMVALSMFTSNIPSKGQIITRTSDVRNSILRTMGPLLGVAITLVIIGIVAGMSIIGAQDSANLASGANFLSQFLTLIGVVVALSIVIGLLKGL